MEEPVEAALTEANISMQRRLMHARMNEAAWAARTAYHALTVENPDLRSVPDHLAANLLQMAFATAWNVWE